MTGKNVANKLRDLPREAALMAEKFISDILFEAALGNIIRSTKMTLSNNEPSQQQSATNPYIQPDFCYQNQQFDGTSSHVHLSNRKDYGSSSNQILSNQSSTENARSYLANFSPDFTDL